MIVLVAIGGASLLWWQRKRRTTRQTQGHRHPRRSDVSLWSRICRRAGLYGGYKFSPKPEETNPTRMRVNKLDVDELPPAQQIPESVLVRESHDGPNWLPELPSHQEINLHNSVATAPPPPSRGSVAQTNLTLQRLHQNLVGSDGPLSLPPRALVTRQSTMSSTYADSLMSSAPSSRPSTIVYPSPLRPRPTTRNAPR